MSKIYDSLSVFLSISLYDLAIKYNYSEENLLILSENENLLKEKYPDVYKNILSCTHNRDKRTPFQYAKDLVSSWLFEDYLINEIKSHGYSLQLSGKDKERKILSNSNVGANSDMQFNYNNKSLKIEIINDYTGFWKKTGKLHLRDQKFKKMQLENSLLLAISIDDKSYALIPINEKTKAKYINNHKPFGFKPAYELDIKNSFDEFVIEKIINDILSQFK